MAQWGNVAEWVGSIGTTGALLLGVFVLRRDRQSAERQQARKVASWFEYSGDGDGICFVHNASDQPITAVSLLAESPWTSPTTGKPTRIYKRWASIQPQTTEQAARSLSEEGYAGTVHDFDIYVTFKDAAGFDWQLADDGKLSKSESMPRWVRKKSLK